LRAGSIPSASARWTAAQRDRLAGTRPATPGADLEGESRLYRNVAGSTAALPMARTGDLRLRTAVIDREVGRAIGRNVTQIVLVGAGYDGRALRFAGDASHWFEVDRAAVLADKQRRLQSLGLTPSGVVPVALELEAETEGASEGEPEQQGSSALDARAGGLDVRLHAALTTAGHDSSRATLFVCESALLPLALGTMATLCSALRARATPDSVMVATFAVTPEATGLLRAVRVSSGVVSRALGEARGDELRPGDPEKLAVVTGWHVTHTEHGSAHRLDRAAHQVVLVCEPDGDRPD
jgi:O-methyltransferase involved in polyketide biosynthesis